MSRIAIFYHCRPSGGSPPIQVNHAISVIQEQFSAFARSGLADAAEHFVIGVSGGDEDAALVAMLAPAKATVLHHPEGSGDGEIPTLRALQQWIAGHKDWIVFYLHSKGVCYPGNTTWAAWRRCMEKVVVWNWRECAKDLQDGFDCVGPHWLTPQSHPAIVTSPYFGGNFWAATARHLSRLATLEPKASRYEGEAWIGRTHQRISVRPYSSHFPGAACMA